MRTLFVDTDCPEPMTSAELGLRPMGGTESTLFRVSDGLASLYDQEVIIAQHNRQVRDFSSAGVNYINYQFNRKIEGEDPDAIVVLRNFKILPKLRRQYPKARLFLWMHCYPGSRWKRCAEILRETKATIVAVSDHLRGEMIDMLQPPMNLWEARQHVTKIYNPIADQLLHRTAKSTFNKDRLLFISSPHKGLEEVLEKFQALRQQIPSLELGVADPGYWRGPRPESIDGVINLGSLEPEELYRQVESALCVFYPQTWFAETFGLIFAEANILGTPVIAHDLGAAKETLSKGGLNQIHDCHDLPLLIDTISSWRNGHRPQVEGSHEFLLTTVVNQWVGTLSGENARKPGIPMVA